MNPIYNSRKILINKRDIFFVFRLDFFLFLSIFYIQNKYLKIINTRLNKSLNRDDNSRFQIQRF